MRRSLGSMFLKNNVKADREDEVSLFKEKLFASP